MGRGCPECRGTGYHGRTGIYEVMETTEKLRDAIDGKATPMQLRKLAMANKMSTLRESAVRKLLNGVTTVDEVIRVTGPGA